MFSKVILLFALVSSADAKTNQPVAKPTKKPVSPPFKKTKSPTMAPTVLINRTTDSKDIKDFNTFLPLSDPDGKYSIITTVGVRLQSIPQFINFIHWIYAGAIEDQYLTCKNNKNIYQIFGNKVGGTFKSFGVLCEGNGGKWRTLGPNTVPSKFHSSWIGGQKVTSLTVYKWLDPKLGYYVVSNINVCTLSNADVESCHGFGNLAQCSSASKICVIEKTVASEGQTLSHWFFRSIINSAETTETPGNLLEVKASASPFPSASV